MRNDSVVTCLFSLIIRAQNTGFRLQAGWPRTRSLWEWLTTSRRLQYHFLADHPLARSQFFHPSPSLSFLRSIFSRDFSRRTRTAPHRLSLSSRTRVDSPEEKVGFAEDEISRYRLRLREPRWSISMQPSHSSWLTPFNQVEGGLSTLKSWAAMEFAGELGFGSLNRDWMLVSMADTS